VFPKPEGLTTAEMVVYPMLNYEFYFKFYLF
jgi:hypothetical protein